MPRLRVIEAKQGILRGRDDDREEIIECPHLSHSKSGGVFPHGPLIFFAEPGKVVNVIYKDSPDHDTLIMQSELPTDFDTTRH
jgi:hypothetical protein